MLPLISRTRDFVYPIRKFSLCKSESSQSKYGVEQTLCEVGKGLMTAAAIMKWFQKDC